MKLNDMHRNDREETDEREEYFDELEYSSLKGSVFKKAGAKLTNKPEALFVILGVVLAGMILFFVMFRPNASTEEQENQLKPLESRIEQVETYSTQISALETRLKQLEDQLLNAQFTDKKAGENNKKLDTLSDHYAKLDANMADIRTKLNLLEKKASPSPQKADAQEKSADTPKPKITKAPSPPPKMETKRYHQILQGDTLYSISRQYKMSVNELCQLNNITLNNSIHPGQKLLVK